MKLSESAFPVIIAIPISRINLYNESLSMLKVGWKIFLCRSKDERKASRG